MDKRYQVFVSSTFRDLIKERRAVMQALLELDCIPAGMELFPATSDDQWTLITRIIDDCDYYLVIVGGRYGSAAADGISYTEKEYDYAVSQGKPVMGFIHKDPGSIPSKHVDSDPAVQERLAAFKAKVEKRHCKYWLSADDLGGVISRSYVQLIKTHPAEGWVKARNAKTTEELEKVNQMHEKIRILEMELETLRKRASPDASFLAQGADPVTIFHELKRNERVGFLSTWNEVFLVVAKQVVDYSTAAEVRRALNRWIADSAAAPAGGIADESFALVKLQLVCLGLITFSLMTVTGFPATDRMVTKNFWVLTDRGRQAYAELAGVKKGAL